MVILMMENISLESLDLKNNQTNFCQKLDVAAEMSPYEKRRYRNKLLFVWGIPLVCGIFSFIYWFVFVPLLWSALPHQDWPLVWFSFYGLVAFTVWLAIMALCLLWWRHKHNTIVACSQSDDGPYIKESSSKTSSNDSGFKDSPPFPTKVSAVQPVANTPCSSLNSRGGSAVCIPIQPDNTPSLYNSRTGRESYEAGYQLDSDSEPASSSVSVQSVIPKVQETGKQNSGVLLPKKMDSLKENLNKEKRCISSSESDVSNPDLVNDFRDSGDGLENCISSYSSKSPDFDDVKSFQTENVVAQITNEEPNGKTDLPTDLPAPLIREESYQGLPEMNSFGEYLQLVTIETPMSPREVFFSNLTVDKPSDAKEVQMRSPRDRKSYCVSDVLAAQQRITHARKSLPLFMYESDMENGQKEPLHPASFPHSPTVLEIVDESPHTSPTIKEHQSQLKNLETVYDGVVSNNEDGTVPLEKANIVSAESESAGNYFIANVLRTESITSEVYLNIEGDSPTGNVMRWETTVSVDPIQEEDFEGKWVVLSHDYAANNLEAFIRLESEAMSRERTKGILPQFDDLDNDSVFLESDLC